MSETKAAYGRVLTLILNKQEETRKTLNRFHVFALESAYKKGKWDGMEELCIVVSEWLNKEK